VTAQVAIAVAVGLAASAEDLIHRKISNWIAGAALVSGVALQALHEGWHGALYALLGAAAGFGVFLIFYVLGGMGGGDVKLMAGFGALLGIPKVLEAALWTAGCGGLLAVVVIGASTVRGLLRATGPVAAGASGMERARAGAGAVQSIPYAPAIAAGVWLSLIPKG